MGVVSDSPGSTPHKREQQYERDELVCRAAAQHSRERRATAAAGTTAPPPGERAVALPVQHQLAVAVPDDGPRVFLPDVLQHHESSQLGHVPDQPAEARALHLAAPSRGAERGYQRAHALLADDAVPEHRRVTRVVLHHLAAARATPAGQRGAHRREAELPGRERRRHRVPWRQRSRHEQKQLLQLFTADSLQKGTRLPNPGRKPWSFVAVYANG